MDCAQIKNLLSPYIEGELDAERKTLLERHLSSCSACAKELAGLKETLAALKKTPEVQPPPYFVQAVRARLEKKPAFSEFLRKLFVPFHIKVPLQAITVTATVILLVVLVQKSEIKKVIPVGMPMDMDAPGESYVEKTDSQEKTVDKLARTEQPLSGQYAELDSQLKFQEQDGLRVAKLEEAESPERIIEVFKGKAQPLEGEAIQVERRYREEPALEAEADLVLQQPVVMSATSDTFEAGELATKTPLPEKEIILRTVQLNQDIPRLELILKDLGITNVGIEHQPDKALFSFSIQANQLEVLISRLKDWQIIIQPAKDIATTEETSLSPISVKLTLITQ